MGHILGSTTDQSSLTKESTEGLSRSGPSPNLRRWTSREAIARVYPFREILGVRNVERKTSALAPAVHSAIVHCSRGECSTRHLGRGRTAADAEAGALMEALEQYSAAEVSEPTVVSSLGDIRMRYEAIDPASLVAPRIDRSHDGIFEWLIGKDLLSGGDVAIPREAIICPPSTAPRATFISSSNGLAAGGSLAEAAFYALAEVLERHAVGIFRAAMHIGPRVREVACRLGLRMGSVDQPPHCYPLISTQTLPVAARVLGEELRVAGVKVTCRDLSGVTGVATFECTLWTGAASREEICFGTSAHLDSETALLQALLEALEVRACTTGNQRPGDATWFNRAVLYDTGPEHDFAQVPSVWCCQWDSCLDQLVESARKAGFTQLASYDVSHPAIGIPVVRVVVPGAETWTVYQAHLGYASLGPGALAATLAPTMSHLVNDASDRRSV
jgi:ribosomal protein S12 methylthiotransferase accessory factor YcaO